MNRKPLPVTFHSAEQKDCEDHYWQEIPFVVIVENRNPEMQLAVWIDQANMESKTEYPNTFCGSPICTVSKLLV